MYNIPEQRKYVRIERPYITRFRVKPCDDFVTKDWDTVAVINLSAGGIFFYAGVNLEVGTILDLKIDFSRSHPSIICVGRVIRVKRHLDTCILGYTIEFTEIDEQIKIMINKRLEIAEWQKNISSPF